MKGKRIAIAALVLLVLAFGARSKWLACGKGRDIGVVNDMLAAADVGKGREISHECAVCHSLEAGAPNRIGPNLFGIVGEDIARKGDFSYSYALQKMRDKAWTIDNLDRWLKDPAAFVPGTKMVFLGIADPQDRMDLIAYLMTLK